MKYEFDAALEAIADKIDEITYSRTQEGGYSLMTMDQFNAYKAGLADAHTVIEALIEERNNSLQGQMGKAMKIPYMNADSSRPIRDGELSSHSDY